MAVMPISRPKLSLDIEGTGGRKSGWERSKDRAGDERCACGDEFSDSNGRLAGGVRAHTPQEIERPKVLMLKGPGAANRAGSRRWARASYAQWCTRRKMSGRIVPHSSMHDQERPKRERRTSIINEVDGCI